MYAASPFSSRLQLLSISLIILLVTAGMVGCGSVSGSSQTKLTGNTAVNVVLTGTANDSLTAFDMQIQSIALTSQKRNVVTLLSSSAPSISGEFIHINGNAEPLLTATVPQDVYTSATLTVGTAEFSCVDLYVTGPGGQGLLNTHTFDDLGVAPTSVTVKLPSPITVTGSNMLLSLALNVGQSASYSSCYDPGGVYTFAITPNFTLAALNFSSSPTNAANGKVTGIEGEVSAISSSGQGFTLSVDDFGASRSIPVSSNSNTLYQGISGISALAVGSFLDMDGTLQSDGSMIATRVYSADANATEVFNGPLMQVDPSAVLQFPRLQQGSGLNGFLVGSQFIDYNQATFHISEAVSNLGGLPFVPSFGASNMVPGQEVYFTIDSPIVSTAYPVAATMTLVPQTINGTVTAAAQVGNFTDYTVSLASYDLFPMLAVQPGQNTVENNPSQIEVYVDNNTQQLNTQSIAAGNTLRFYGLVFNDNGTLRMDCEQVNDGVSLAASVSSSAQVAGQTQSTRSKGSASMLQSITTVRSH